MGKITTKKRILFSFRGQVTINGQIMSEKPGIFCAQNGQKLWVFGQPGGGEKTQSAVASAAYRSATKIYCEYDGEVKDFSRKGHVIYSQILLPEYAPKEFADI